MNIVVVSAHTRTVPVRRLAAVVLGSTVLLAGASPVLADPIIAGITPASGSTAGGLALTISGGSFSASGNSATLDGNECHVMQESTNVIVCTTPEGTGFVNEVQVVDANGVGSNTRNFSYDPPAITSIAPSSGPAAGGTVLTLTGTNFGPASADALRSVSMGAVGACDIVSGGGDHTEVLCTTPAGSGGTVDVSILVDGQASNTVSYDFVPAPSITSLAASAAPTAGGTMLTIFGSDFSASGNAVTVGGSTCPVDQENTGAVLCTLPVGTGIDNEVRVTSGGQQSNAALFNYDPPSITSILPDHGPTEGNVPITIQGTNFGPPSADSLRSVTVGTSVCTLVASASDHDEVQCTLPEGQGLGRTVLVEVDQQVSNASTFDYDAPAIDSITPTQVSALGGTPITIYGSNFGTSATVKVNGNTVGVVHQWHTAIDFLAPAGSAGVVPILVDVSGQQASTTVDYVAPACGNGILDTQVGEVCDDNNSSSGDGCSSDCRGEHTETDDQAACIVAMNKAGAGVFKAAGKDLLACAKKGDGTACVGGTASTGLTAAKDKVATAFDKKCPTAPDFGSSSVAVVQDANGAEVLALAEDLFGADPDAALAPSALAPNRGRCQDAVLKAELKYAGARLKAFGKCKKEGLKEPAILTDSALAACLVIADADPSAAKPAAAQFATMIDSCLNLAEDMTAAFPGVCASAPDVGACIEDRVRCRTCRALQATDTLYVDCDDDDDGIDNSSCEE